MKNSFSLILAFFIVVLGYSQDQRQIIKGKVTSKVGSLENIHVINKNSNKALVTNSKGTFEIPVKERDTLLFSSVQFENKIVVINAEHIAILTLEVPLKISVNKINEVNVKKPENMAVGLGLPNAGKEPLNELDARLNYHTKSSLPIAILAALLNKRGGINDMHYIISGKRKKDRRLKKLIDEDSFNLYQSQKIQEIRKKFNDSFFTNTLKIPKEDIDYFIEFCDGQGAIVTLYGENRNLEVIDIFIKLSKEYLEKVDEKK